MILERDDVMTASSQWAHGKVGVSLFVCGTADKLVVSFKKGLKKDGGSAVGTASADLRVTVSCGIRLSVFKIC
jgi:hypothetical protein